MIEPLQSLIAKAHAFGGEIDLEWVYPDALPDQWKLYIFKRRDIPPTQAEIDDYFARLTAGTLSGFNYNGLFVNIDVDNFQTTWSDFGGNKEHERLKNEKHYYYKASIYDKQAPNNYSALTSADALVARNVRVNILDGKDIVARAIERVIDGQVAEDGTRLDLKKYVDVLKHLPETTEKLDFIVVSRLSSNTRYQFMNAFIAQYGSQLVRGDIDADIIEVTIQSIDNPDRRDTLMNIFRAYKLAIRRYCMKKGCLEAIIMMGGDARDPSMNNVRLAQGSFHVALLIENQITQSDLLSLDAEIAPTFVETLSSAVLPSPLFPSGGNVTTYLKTDVIIDPSAISPDTAQAFTTNFGQLTTDIKGKPFPTFFVAPFVQAVAQGDYSVIVDPDTISVDGNNNVTFMAYLGFGEVPPSGDHKASFIFMVY